MINSTRKFPGAIEVATTLLLYFLFKYLLGTSNFGEWQEPILGAAIVSSSLLFFVLPICMIFLRGLEPSAMGLSGGDWAIQFRQGLRAIAFIAPTTMLFPVLGLLETTPYEWSGSFILSLGFIAAGFVFAKYSRNSEIATLAKVPWTGALPYLAILTLGLIACFVLQPVSPLATRLVTVIIFVGMLEEVFFRGYVQTRLNQSFGRPFEFQGVNFGVGMIVGAVFFGIAHPLSSVGDIPWAWALWTAAFGLVCGFLREKTGSIVAPATLHAALLIPMVLFGGGG